MPSTLLVAHDKNRVIGNMGQIPWHIPRDLQLFKAMTLGETVIMGRVTWESIAHRLGEPILPGRVNVVVTRQFKDMQTLYSSRYTDLPLYFVSLENAMNLAKKGDPESSFVIGGSQIYKAALEEKEALSKVRVSLVPSEYEGDAFFPKLPEHWELKKSDPENGFSLLHYSNILLENEDSLVGEF